MGLFSFCVLHGWQFIFLQKHVDVFYGLCIEGRHWLDVLLYLVYWARFLPVLFCLPGHTMSFASRFKLGPRAVDAEDHREPGELGEDVLLPVQVA